MKTEELSVKLEERVNVDATNEIKHPWEYPMVPTPVMKILANRVIRCLKSTNKFIQDVEGQPDRQVS